MCPHIKCDVTLIVDIKYSNAVYMYCTDITQRFLMPMERADSDIKHMHTVKHTSIVAKMLNTTFNVVKVSHILLSLNRRSMSKNERESRVTERERKSRLSELSKGYVHYKYT